MVPYEALKRQAYEERRGRTTEGGKSLPGPAAMAAGRRVRMGRSRVRGRLRKAAAFSSRSMRGSGSMRERVRWICRILRWDLTTVLEPVLQNIILDTDHEVEFFSPEAVYAGVLSAASAEAVVLQGKQKEGFL